MTDEERFLAIVTADPTVRTVLERAPALGVGDWWLTAALVTPMAGAHRAALGRRRRNLTHERLPL